MEIQTVIMNTKYHHMLMASPYMYSHLKMLHHTYEYNSNSLSNVQMLTIKNWKIKTDHANRTVMI